MLKLFFTLPLVPPPQGRGDLGYLAACCGVVHWTRYLLRYTTAGRLKKDRTVVITITNAERETSSLNLSAIRSERTIVGIAPSIRHDARALPESPSRAAVINEIKGTTASLMTTAGTIA